MVVFLASARSSEASKGPYHSQRHQRALFEDAMQNDPGPHPGRRVHIIPRSLWITDEAGAAPENRSDCQVSLTGKNWKDEMKHKRYCEEHNNDRDPAPPRWKFLTHRHYLEHPTYRSLFTHY